LELISEVIYATQRLLLAGGVTDVFFSIWSHFALYSSISKTAASSYPEKHYQNFLLKYKL